MRERARIFGNNVRYLLFQKGISINQFAHKLDYTEMEVQKILDARMILDREEKEAIRCFLQVDSVDVLYIPREEMEYEVAGCLECRGTFENPANKELILDIFDLYCDMQEAIVEVEK